eukprot:2544498-Rhodomonas_salina.2
MTTAALRSTGGGGGGGGGKARDARARDIRARDIRTRDTELRAEHQEAAEGDSNGEGAAGQRTAERQGHVTAPMMPRYRTHDVTLPGSRGHVASAGGHGHVTQRVHGGHGSGGESHEGGRAGHAQSHATTHVTLIITWRTDFVNIQFIQSEGGPRGAARGGKLGSRSRHVTPEGGRGVGGRRVFAGIVREHRCKVVGLCTRRLPSPPSLQPRPSVTTL